MNAWVVYTINVIALTLSLLLGYFFLYLPVQHLTKDAVNEGATSTAEVVEKVLETIVNSEE